MFETRNDKEKWRFSSVYATTKPVLHSTAKLLDCVQKLKSLKAFDVHLINNNLFQILAICYAFSAKLKSYFYLTSKKKLTVLSCCLLADVHV